MEMDFTILYAYLAQAFRYPTRETVSFLTDAKVLEEVRKVEAGFSFEQSTLEELEQEYIRTFGHTLAGFAPLYELEYGQGQLVSQTYSLGAIGGFYQAFDVKPRTDIGERIDHISVECEFLSWLSYKQTHAGLKDHKEGLDICRRAHAQFLKEHLAYWGFSFCAKVCQIAEKGAYVAWAQLLKAVLKKDCLRYQIPMGKEDLILRLPEPEPSEKCGELQREAYPS